MTDAVFSQVYAREDLLKWQVAHEINLRFTGEGLVVSDTARHSYHLLRLYSSEFLYRLVRIKCILRRLPTSTVNFYVHHVGYIDVAEISLSGAVVNEGIARNVIICLPDNDLIEVELEFLSCHPSISVGCSADRHPVYVGTGGEQFEILQIHVETRDATSEFSKVPEEERIRLVDIGGAGGLEFKWMLRADCITPVLFEPIPSEAEVLRNTICRIPGGRVVEAALAHVSGVRKLHIARASGCSSLLEPNFEILNRYPIGPIFQIIKEQDVRCERYDELFRDRQVPRPDVLKIDVQGFEYEVLLGFGGLLQTCLGIELEAHFYPIYRGQILIGDIVEYLEQFGFALRAVRQAPSFNGDFVECDAFFTKRRNDVMNLSELDKKKFATVTKVWELPPYF